MFASTVTRALTRLGLEQRGSAQFPRPPVPMLMHRADQLRVSPDWTYEPKWDGFRVIAVLRDGGVRLVSRNGHAFTHLFGAVSDALRGFPASMVLDGEVICINDQVAPTSKRCSSGGDPGAGNCPGISATWCLTTCT